MASLRAARLAVRAPRSSRISLRPASNSASPGVYFGSNGSGVNSVCLDGVSISRSSPDFNSSYRKRGIEMHSVREITAVRQ